MKKTAFSPDPKACSLPFKEVMSGGGVPPWYSAAADRHPVPHADLQLISDCISGNTFLDDVAANVWVGAMVQWQHQVAIKKRGAEQWFLGLRCFPGSCVLVWPCALRESPGADDGMQYFVPVAELEVPTLLTVSRFDSWEAASFEMRSPAWQHANCPVSRGLWATAGIRFVKSSDTLPLLKLGAQCGFWSLGRPWLQKLCANQGIELSEGTEMVDALWEICGRILGDGTHEHPARRPEEARRDDRTCRAVRLGTWPC